MKQISLIFCIILIVTQAFCQDKLNIVATSAWTGAYLQLAGIEHYKVIAPSGMQHPTEYELQLSDIEILKNADLIVCGGYETMVDDIRNGLKIPESKIMQIKTDYNYENIKKAVFDIARKAKTNSIAGINIEYLYMSYADCQLKIKEAGLDSVTVLAQFFLQSIASELNMNVTGVFGPRHLEHFEIGELMKKDFQIILDNAHNPSAKPLLESNKEAKIAYLLNFPGSNGTSSLEDVVNYNTEQILRLIEKD